MYKNPCLMVDAYKLGHYFQMPPGVQTIYSTWTARNAKHHENGVCRNTVVFGAQGFISDTLVHWFNKNFFDEDIDAIEADFRRKVSAIFSPDYVDFKRFRDLHDLGYLPVTILGVPEGTLLPTNIPDHIIFNTDPNFSWLPQYLEDIWSCHMWLPSTSATTAYYRRKTIEGYAEQCCDNPHVVARHMCGDFSMRGMENEDAAYVSSAGHLLSFDRTATVEANAYLEQFYKADIENATPGLGVPSLEHSVVCQNVAYYKECLAEGRIPDYMKPYVKVAIHANWEANLVAEMCFILRLLIEIQPKGVLTYVSDTYDYWGVVTKILPVIKDVILNREGCFSVRPDSGDPYAIVCGDNTVSDNSRPQALGTLRVLKNIFGMSENNKGYGVLPSQIRMIYGDAITADLTDKICSWCVRNGISIENIAFGIGAYTYQYVTRDTRGYAIKATDAYFADLGEVPLYKAPKTDPSKNSPHGCISVRINENGRYQMVDGLTLYESINDPLNIMRIKMVNGEMKNTESVYDIRDRLWKGKF